MGAIVTLELPADSPVLTLPWIITFGPMDDEEEWEPVVCGPYERIHALSLAETVVADEDLMAAVQRWVPMFTGTALRWDRLDLLREHWDGPIVLKGIQHVDDALHAVDVGIDGIVVSNHGGRQVDRAIGSLDALPEIVAAVDGRAAVLFDSGIRSGADAALALALGADAVLLGRPYVYGLALGGQDGVRHVLRSVLAELDLTLALSGFSDLAQLRAAKDVVRHLAYTGA